MADWITTKQATEQSGYNPVFLRALMRSGKIKGQKWGREWQVSQRSLTDYLEKARKSTDKRWGPKRKRG